MERPVCDSSAVTPQLSKLLLVGSSDGRLNHRLHEPQVDLNQVNMLLCALSLQSRNNILKKRRKD
jgi:hypothetical protein